MSFDFLFLLRLPHFFLFSSLPSSEYISVLSSFLCLGLINPSVATVFLVLLYRISSSTPRQIHESQHHFIWLIPTFWVVATKVTYLLFAWHLQACSEVSGMVLN